MSYREVVFSNALQSMQAVVKGFDFLAISIPSARLGDAEFLLNFDSDNVVSNEGNGMEPRCVDAIKRMWAEESTKRVVSMSSKFQLNDSAQ